MGALEILFIIIIIKLVSDDHEMSACINRPIQVPVDTVLHVYLCVRDLATPRPHPHTPLPPPPTTPRTSILNVLKS